MVEVDTFSYPELPALLLKSGTVRAFLEEICAKIARKPTLGTIRTKT